VDDNTIHYKGLDHRAGVSLSPSRRMLKRVPEADSLVEASRILYRSERDEPCVGRWYTCDGQPAPRMPRAHHGAPRLHTWGDGRQ